MRVEAARHDQIARLFLPGDRVIYLGDVIGLDAGNRGVVDGRPLNAVCSSGQGDVLETATA